jgi:hypothetical protein
MPATQPGLRLEPINSISCVSCISWLSSIERFRRRDHETHEIHESCQTKVIHRLRRFSQMCSMPTLHQSVLLTANSCAGCEGFSRPSSCFKPRMSRMTRMTKESKDRKMGTEIFRTSAPNPYFSVPIFLSDSSSSSGALFESFGAFVVSCHWFRSKSRR